MTHEFVKRSNEMGKIMFEVVISNLIMKETKPNATQMSVLSASVKRCALKCVITLPNVAPIASRKSIQAINEPWSDQENNLTLHISQLASLHVFIQLIISEL